MLQTVNRQQSFHHVIDDRTFAGLATSAHRQRRSAQAPDLRLAFTPAAQGTSAAVDQVPTAADFPWFRNGIPGTARPRTRTRTAVGLRPGVPAGPVSIRLLLRPASQGGVAVAGGGPAAATLCGSTHSPRLAASGAVDMATHSTGRPLASGYGSTLSVAVLSPPSQGRLAAVEYPSTAAIFSRFRLTAPHRRLSAVQPPGAAWLSSGMSRRQPPLSRPCLTPVAPNGGGAT